MFFLGIEILRQSSINLLLQYLTKFFLTLYFQVPTDITSLSSPTSASGQGNLLPNVTRNTKYSRLATTGSPSHSKVNSTQELLQQQIRQQEHLVNHQDAQLSQMSQSVGTLRNMSSAIGNELDEQAVMLDEFGGKNAFIYLRYKKSTYVL